MVTCRTRTQAAKRPRCGDRGCGSSGIQAEAQGSLTGPRPVAQTCAHTLPHQIAAVRHADVIHLGSAGVHAGLQMLQRALLRGLHGPIYIYIYIYIKNWAGPWAGFAHGRECPPTPPAPWPEPSKAQQAPDARPRRGPDHVQDGGGRRGQTGAKGPKALSPAGPFTRGRGKTAQRL